MGNCLAGETCVFSHDPSKLMAKLTLDGTGTPPNAQSAIHLQDMNSFPALQHGPSDGYNTWSPGMTPPPGLRNFHSTESPRSRSRPGSRQRIQETPPAIAPSLDDNEAFPSLGSASGKAGKKHHGKRGGHGHNSKENIVPSSLADIVKMSPSPAPESPRPSTRRPNGAYKNGENSAASQAIPSPKHVPWLETGDRANKAYLKARQEAIKHGGLRNKFLQRYVHASASRKKPMGCKGGCKRQC